MKQQRKREPRKCKICGAAEQKIVGGMYTTIAPHLGICADCINRIIKK
jgi:hypothetical protein